MAIIQLGTTVTAVRGTIGGITYSTNTNGPYAKSHTQPTNPRTYRQQTIRNTLQYLANLWNLLPDTSRALWNDYATLDPEPTYNSLGQLLKLTGFNYFLRCNTRLIATQQPTLTNPGPTTRPDPATTLDFTYNVHPPKHLFIEWTMPSPPPNLLAIIFLAFSPFATPSYKPQSRKLAAYTLASNRYYESATLIDSLFGDIPIRTTLFATLYIRNILNGLDSLPIHDHTMVIP